MSNFMCCIWWFLAGLLVGWLLWQLFDKFFRRDGEPAGVRLQRELDSANAKFSGLQAELNTSRTSLTTKANELSGLHNQFNLKSEEATKLNGDLTGLRALIGERDAEISRLRASLNATENKANVSAAAAAAATGLATAAGFGFTAQKNGKDDLIIIEGIGPKINELLLAAGIDTFRKLADAPIAQVQQILDAAGPHFRLANPTSWAKQSDMCARADWATLRKYQDDLTAGVDKKDNT
jgi:predicted flap endonuclease-1-like 5' DNA nuclease